MGNLLGLILVFGIVFVLLRVILPKLGIQG